MLAPGGQLDYDLLQVVGQLVSMQLLLPSHPARSAAYRQQRELPYYDLGCCGLQGLNSVATLCWNKMGIHFRIQVQITACCCTGGRMAVQIAIHHR